MGTAADTAAAGVGFILRTALKAIMTVLLVLITTGLLFVCIFAFYVKTCLMEDLNVSLEEMTLSLSSKILYQDGSEWKELATLYSDEDRIWMDFEDIPLNLQHAAVAIEDKHFYTHKGVDWFRTVGAFANMFVGMRNNFGGSTITQQLIKNLTEYDDVTVQRKLLEIFRALEFEKIYTKDEIITWYLNEIYLGERCYGVGTAARMYFGKEVYELDLAECASLIGITNNPSLYDPYISRESRERNKARAKTIL
ncbi:MAG: transglycosylase domain-containing protein, partial [Oscillospiraceae bacterium]|nr:transglycosylase domain-containing protein [Oscillospiraceae bacterium]